MPESLAGQLLVAATSMNDPNFDRSVVFVVEHGDEGAVGVVINRPLDLPLGEAVPEWSGRGQHPEVVFSGGPVAQGSALALARLDDPVDERHIIDGVALIDLSIDAELQPDARTVRVYSGYSGWEGGQLEGELAVGAWHVFPAESTDVFCPSPDEVWPTVLRRQGGDFELLADYPPAPWLN